MGESPPDPSRVWTFMPIHRRDGSVCAFTLLDAQDYECAKEWPWHLSKGYARRCLPGTQGRKQIRLHREICGLENGELEVDHINRDKLDNRRTNLRIADRYVNNQNTSPRSPSGFRGVHYAGARYPRKPWVAYSAPGGKHRRLGYFATAEEAAEVARKFREENMPYATD